jgi:hypothetical protein
LGLAEVAEYAIDVQARRARLEADLDASREEARVKNDELLKALEYIESNMKGLNHLPAPAVRGDAYHMVLEEGKAEPANEREDKAQPANEREDKTEPGNESVGPKMEDTAAFRDDLRRLANAGLGSANVHLDDDNWEDNRDASMDRSLDDDANDKMNDTFNTSALSFESAHSQASVFSAQFDIAPGLEHTPSTRRSDRTSDRSQYDLRDADIGNLSSSSRRLKYDDAGMIDHAGGVGEDDGYVETDMQVGTFSVSVKVKSPRRSPPQASAQQQDSKGHATDKHSHEHTQHTQPISPKPSLQISQRYATGRGSLHTSQTPVPVKLKSAGLGFDIKNRIRDDPNPLFLTNFRKNTPVGERWMDYRRVMDWIRANLQCHSDDSNAVVQALDQLIRDSKRHRNDAYAVADVYEAGAGDTSTNVYAPETGIHMNKCRTGTSPGGADTEGAVASYRGNPKVLDGIQADLQAEPMDTIDPIPLSSSSSSSSSSSDAKIRSLEEEMKQLTAEAFLKSSRIRDLESQVSLHLERENILRSELAEASKAYDAEKGLCEKLDNELMDVKACALNASERRLQSLGQRQDEVKRLAEALEEKIFELENAQDEIGRLMGQLKASRGPEAQISTRGTF